MNKLTAKQARSIKKFDLTKNLQCTNFREKANFLCFDIFDKTKLKTTMACIKIEFFDTFCEIDLMQENVLFNKIKQDNLTVDESLNIIETLKNKIWKQLSIKIKGEF